METVLPEDLAGRKNEWLGGESAPPQERASIAPRLRGVFALRALRNRGRAWPTSETPAAFVRLIGGGTSRPRTRSAAKVPASPGLPDPLAHLRGPGSDNILVAGTSPTTPRPRRGDAVGSTTPAAAAGAEY